MKKARVFLAIVFLAISSIHLLAQGSFKDEFNLGTLGTGWYQSGEYGLSVESNQLKVDVNKSTMWASFGVNFTAIDVRTKPIVNLKVKTDEPFILTVWLMSASGNININHPVQASSGFTNISLDFTGKDVSSNVLNAVRTIAIGTNGAALSWKGIVYFDDLKLGTESVKLANVSSVADQVFYQGTTTHKIFLRGISNAASLTLTGADALIQNISFDPIASDGTTWMKFDCKAGVNASATATLTAVGASGYNNNTTTFLMDVEGNRAPVIDNIANVQAAKNVQSIVELTGISDGNASAEQIVLVTASSGNTAVIDNQTIEYFPGSKYGKVKFTPKAAGTAVITVNLNDQQASNNTASKTFTVTVLDTWNNAPTIDPIMNMEVLNNAGEQTINLTGISDGDVGSQTLTITASSSATGIIPNPSVQYVNGSANATIKFTPVAGQSGFSTITINVADNGGVVGNNGNQSKQITFTVEAYSPPLTGYVIPFTAPTPNAFGTVQAGIRDYWHVEGMGTTQTVTHVTEGTDKVFQIVCNAKSTWTGSWYYTPDMDLTDFPLLSMWVKCDKAILFHAYFWDDSIRNNEDHHLQFSIPANTWTKVNFDFSDPTGMLNGDGEVVNAKRIKRVLFNYHPTFGWPFTNWNGTVSFKDVRIGDQSGIVPTYYCTVDPVGQLTYFKDANPKTIKLTGISRGKDNVATVAVTGNGTLKSLSVSPVVNGEATVTFTPSAAGTDVLTVKINGAAISGKVPVEETMTINVAIVDKATSTPSVATFNQASTKQTYRGFGAKDPAPNMLDLYTKDGFGATAIRFGILDGNQIEPENDNGDPNVLDRSKLNYGAFDWNYIRGLKAQGVETFIVTLWSPPAWMKENMSTNYQQAAALTWDATINRVMTAYYDEYAEMAVALVAMFKEEAGIDLAGIGLQNEPAFCEPYASAILGPTQFADMIARTGTRFAALGITTKLYVAEQVGVPMSAGPIYNNQSYLDAINSNATAKTYSDVFAVHGYASDGISPGETPGSTDWLNTYTAINSNGKTRELWMTETEPPFANWNDAFVNAANILTGFESGNVALWTEWAWDGHCIEQGKPTQKYWAQSMFSYIKPGAKRFTSASNHTDILMTAWKNDVAHGDNVVMVIMNKGNSALTLNITQADMPADYTVYRCSEQVPQFKDGKYTKGDKLLLAPRSIVTLTSGFKAIPTINQVASQLIMNDGANKTISLAGISDGNTPNVNSIAVTYSSSNASVLSNTSITYTSPNATGTFNYRPAANGLTEITINVTAGGTTTSMKFNIEVRDYSVPNINPVVITSPYDLGSGTKTISLIGINDGDDGSQTLTVTAAITATSTSGVISTPAIVYTSPQSTGSLTFSPLKVGTAEITVTVKDNGPAGKNTSTTKFTVEVHEHHAPTIKPIGDTIVGLNKNHTFYINSLKSNDTFDTVKTVTVTTSDEKVTGKMYVSSNMSMINFLTVSKGSATITIVVTDNGPAGKNTSTYTFVLTVSDGSSFDESKDNIVIYPNPVVDVLNVSLDATASIHWKIISIEGRLMMDGIAIADLLSIDVSSLTSGSYILILESRDSKTATNFIRE